MRPGSNRFARLLEASSAEIADSIILETQDFVVAPTLGSIVPGWFLIIPRKFAPTFAAWREQSGVNPLDVVEQAVRKLGRTSNSLWFEHGSVATGASIGCGVDHAHLHLLIDAPFGFDDLVAEVSTFDFGWQRETSVTAYERAPTDAPYLLVGDRGSGRASLATGVEAAGSQFFRRAIARLVNRPDEWDYRRYPMLENVRSTLERYHVDA
ncbi:MAG: HIT domain-containing protein [Hyphomonadaceae bacterium]|nr:HIT domain-containing protein [Hyphomonadaceae bacterium]